MKRNSNIELARFYAAVGILLGHSASKGGGITLSSGLNNVFFHFVGSLANIGSLVLAVISFFFMYNKPFRIRNAVKVWFKTIFYYTVITIALLIMGYVSLDRKTILYFFPVSGRPYWFICTWLLFYMIRPIIDFVLNKMNNTYFLAAVVILLFCIVPLAFSNSVLTNELLYFIALYFVTACCLENIDKLKNIPSWKSIIWIILLIIICSLGDLGVQRLCFLWDIPYSTSFCFFSDARSPFVIALVIPVVCLLVSMPIKNNRFVTYIGGMSLGIYLFHCHPFIKNDLFYSFFRFDRYIDTPYVFTLLLFMIGVTMVIVAILDYSEKIIINFILSNKTIYGCIDLVDEQYGKYLHRLSSENEDRTEIIKQLDGEDKKRC